MGIIKNIIHFIKNGFSGLRRASTGNYEENSPEIQALKDEMFSSPSNKRTDLDNLKKDRNNVAHDVRISFNNLILSNG